MFALTLLTIPVTSCRSGDEALRASIVGSWRRVVPTSEGAQRTELWEFLETGVYKTHTTYSGGIFGSPGKTTYDAGTYVIIDRKITYTVLDSDDVTTGSTMWAVIRVLDDRTLQFENEQQAYQRTSVAEY